MKYTDSAQSFGLERERWDRALGVTRTFYLSNEDERTKEHINM